MRVEVGMRVRLRNSQTGIVVPYIHGNNPRGGNVMIDGDDSKYGPWVNFENGRHTLNDADEYDVVEILSLLPETPRILPAWLDSDCAAYVSRAEKCGFRSNLATARFAAKDIYDRLLVNYGTTSPEIAKEKDVARAAEAAYYINRRAGLVSERCVKGNILTPLGDQCRAI